MTGRTSCAACGAANREGRKFCAGCGAPLPVAPVCGSCGATNEPGERFCGECGQALDAAPSPRADIPPVVGGHAAADDLLVGAQDAMGDGVTPFRAQIGGTLDVAEEDRHRALREAHSHGLTSPSRADSARGPL